MSIRPPSSSPGGSGTDATARAAAAAAQTTANAALPKNAAPGTVRTAAFTLSTTAPNLVDISGGSFAATLPDASTVGAGARVHVKIKAASAVALPNPATSLSVTPASGQTINGGTVNAAIPLRYANQAKVLESDGVSNWTVLSGDFDKTVDDTRNALMFDPLAPGVVTNKTLPSPVFIAHRGGGSSPGSGPVPENSMEGMRALIAAGVKAVNPDIKTTRDGTLVCIHDTSLTRTASPGTALISNLSAADLENTLLNHAVGYGPGWSNTPQRIPTFDDVLLMVGKRGVVFPECSANGQALKMINKAKALGLLSQLIVEAAATSEAIICANAGAAVSLWVTANTTPAAINTAGFTPAMGTLTFDWTSTSILGANLTAALTACYAAGYSVILYNVMRRADLVTIATADAAAKAANPGTSAGIFGYLAEEALYLDAANWTPLTHDSWATGRYGNALLVAGANGTTARVRFAGTNQMGPLLGVTSTGQSILIGEVSPLPSTFTLTVNAQFDGASSNSASALSIAFCQQSDAQFINGTLQNGYELQVTQAGGMSLKKYTNGAITTPQTASSAALVQGVDASFSIQVTSTQIIVRRVDTSTTMTTVTDSAFRNGYVHVGRASSGSALAITDGVSTSGSTTYTSATAAFATATDKNKAITGTNIPTGTTVAAVVDANTITLSQPATASGSSLSASLSRHVFDVLFNTLVIA